MSQLKKNTPLNNSLREIIKNKVRNIVIQSYHTEDKIEDKIKVFLKKNHEFLIKKFNQEDMKILQKYNSAELLTKIKLELPGFSLEGSDYSYDRNKQFDILTEVLIPTKVHDQSKYSESKSILHYDEANKLKKAFINTCDTIRNDLSIFNKAIDNAKQYEDLLEVSPIFKELAQEIIGKNYAVASLTTSELKNINNSSDKFLKVIKSTGKKNVSKKLKT